MADIPHKPIRFPGRPKGTTGKKRSIVIPVLGNDPIEYRIRTIREAGQQCVELLRCVAGVCETIHKRCEPSTESKGAEDGTA